jgi:hypothetical protein
MNEPKPRRKLAIILAADVLIEGLVKAGWEPED